MQNFSTNKGFHVVYGPGSEIGYLMYGNLYMNLDSNEGLSNYFFEWNFENSPNSMMYYKGYQMNI